MVAVVVWVAAIEPRVINLLPYPSLPGHNWRVAVGALGRATDDHIVLLKTSTHIETRFSLCSVGVECKESVLSSSFVCRYDQCERGRKTWPDRLLILLDKNSTRGLGRERIRVGGLMDILAALRQEEAKFQKQADVAKQQLDTVRAAIKILGRGVASNSEPIGKKKRVMSAAARAKISKATKERWAKFRAAKAKGKR
jgi:hypothetical protein